MKILALAGSALALLGAVPPALAFNPQPDPPAKLVWQNIDLAGAVNTYAYAINDGGQIAGYTDDGITTAFGYVRSGNAVTGYAVPGAVSIHAEIRGLNNLGQVAGSYYDGTGLYGFFHDGSSYQRLDPGGTDIFALGLNDAGTVVGTHADAAGRTSGWLWDGGTFHNVAVAGASETHPTGIDNAGDVVGYWTDAIGQPRSFIRRGGVDTTVDIAGSFGTQLLGGHGDTFVGVWWDAQATHGLLLRGDHYLTLDIPGADFTQLTGINADGTLVGIYGTGGNLFHAFSATLAPVPEPASVLLFVLGGAALLVRRRWRPRPALLALLALGLASAGSARAANLDHWVQAWVDARGNGQTLQQNSGQITGPTASAGPVGFQVADAFGSYASSISASAGYGWLSGSAFASQDSPQFARQSDANADSVSFQDRLTLNAASLPFGTPVSLNVTMVLDDQLSAGPTTCCSNVAVSGRYGFGFAYGDQAGPGQSLQHHVVQTQPVTWQIGQPVDVGAILFFDVGSSPGCCGATQGWSRVDQADVQFFVNLPPGVTLSSASGASYAAPVPEPAAALLMALGLAALGLWRRRIA